MAYMNKKLSIVFVAVFLSICFATCSGSNSIVGEWTAAVNGEIKTIAYMSDGAYTVSKEDGTVEEEGTYETEGDRLKITSAYKIAGNDRLDLQEYSDDILTFHIEGKTLTLIMEDGSSITFTKKQ